MPEADTLHRQTFRKAERLCSRLAIENLFSGEGKSISSYPLRVVFIPVENTEAPAVQVLISVPKRHLKHAVDRNRVKRLIRESYRKNKYILTETLGDKQMHVAFLYQSSKILSYQEMESKVKNLLQRIVEKRAEEQIKE